MSFGKLNLTRLATHQDLTGTQLNATLDEIENYINGRVDPNNNPYLDGGGVDPGLPPNPSVVKSLTAVAPLRVSANTGDIVLTDSGGGGGGGYCARLLNSVVPGYHPSGNDFVSGQQIQFGTPDPASVDPNGEFSSAGFTPVTSGYYTFAYAIEFRTVGVIDYVYGQYTINGSPVSPDPNHMDIDIEELPNSPWETTLWGTQTFYVNSGATVGLFTRWTASRGGPALPALDFDIDARTIMLQVVKVG